MASIDNAILVLSGVPDSQFTSQKVASALDVVPGGKATLESKIQKLSAALSASGGRSKGGRRKTRRH